MDNNQRYKDAAHKMQTGVALKISIDSREVEPKHLRVGINSALVDGAAIAKLLIGKGIITLDEYEQAVADAMEEEAIRYQKWIEEKWPEQNIEIH